MPRLSMAEILSGTTTKRSSNAFVMCFALRWNLPSRRSMAAPSAAPSLAKSAIHSSGYQCEWISMVFEAAMVFMARYDGIEEEPNEIRRSAVLHARRVRGSAGLSRPAGEDPGAVRAGRSDRHHRAHRRAAAHRVGRPELPGR